MIVHIQTVEIFPVTTNTIRFMAGPICIINGSVWQIVIAILAVVYAEYVIAATLCTCIASGKTKHRLCLFSSEDNVNDQLMIPNDLFFFYRVSRYGHGVRMVTGHNDERIFLRRTLSGQINRLREFHRFVEGTGGNAIVMAVIDASACTGQRQNEIRTYVLSNIQQSSVGTDILNYR